MNYAIRTLLNQGVLCTNLLDKKEAEFLNKDFEMTSDYEFCRADIANLKQQIQEISEAIEKLSK
jgi:hypothetical protein